MPETQMISADALHEAIRSLNSLAHDEYGMRLEELVAADDPVPGGEYENMEVRDAHDALWRVGRLIGITVKEPFAKLPRARPDGWLSQTGAHRIWTLDEATLGSEHRDWWQYDVISRLLTTEKATGVFDWLPSEHLPEAEQVARFLREADGERGVFRAIARAARPYLCRNPAVEAAAARAGGGSAATGRIKSDRVQVVAEAGIQTTAQAVVAAVPWLDASMVPLVAGLTFVIVTMGLDALCRRTPPEPITGLVET